MSIAWLRNLSVIVSRCIFRSVSNPFFLLSTDANLANHGVRGDSDYEEFPTKSQLGVVVGVTDAAIDDSGECSFSFLVWRSHRDPRVGNSTLLVGAHGISEGLGDLRFVQLLWRWLVNGTDLPARAAQSYPGVLVVDSKSAFDALTTLRSAKNKRIHVELTVIKSELRAHGHWVRRVDTRWMLPDPLTKLHHLGEYLRDVINAGSYSISPEPDALARRSLERARASALKAAKGNPKSAEVLYLAWTVRLQKGLYHK